MNMPGDILSDWSAENAQALVADGKHRKFNRVSLVRNRNTGMQGVCKMLVKNDKNEHLWPLLRTEAQLSFDKAGLPRILAFHENKEEIILIRSYTEGVPLIDFWKNVPARQRAEHMQALLAALAPAFSTLKEKGIVHCDIKPANIIVSGTAGAIRASLIDFGMAIRQSDPPGRKTLFALGYSSPELILNKMNLLDHTSDLFSLGVTFWQLFTGKLPLMHANPGIMTNLQITHPLPAHPAIPKEVFRVLQRMCCKHSFRKPPNLMDQEEVDHLLREAMQQRFGDIEEILSALKSQPRESSWLKNIFGRQNNVFL